MKKDKSLNDEQNLAVYSRGSSILVSAPAGSGKTKILVNRMMSLIEDDHVSVDSLLVLTFTKAAALEMKQRLVESLNKRIHVVDDSLKVHLEKQKILLPLKQGFDESNNSPTIEDIDFEYMINYINNIITNKKSNYKYKIQNKYNNITYDEQLVSLDKKQWKEFNIDELFEADNIYRGKRLTKAKQIIGDTPYISSSGISNGVNNFISNDVKVRKGNNCLTLANSGSVGACFYHQYEFIASDHVTCLKSNKLNEFSYLFVATMLNRLSTKYNFNREINDKRIKREKILLPLNDKGEIDYEYMEQYVKNILIENMSQSEIK